VFGKWLYGQGREDAQALVPDLKVFLKEIETPHLHLHESAIAIGQNFKPVEAGLGIFLSQKKNDHLLWMHVIKDTLLNRSDELKIQLDPTKCGLGRWIYSDHTQSIKAKDDQFSNIIEQIIPFHNQLHQSAKNIGSLIREKQFEKAHTFFVENTLDHAHNTLGKIDLAIGWHNNNVDGVEAAKMIYAQKTIPALTDIQRLLKSIRETARGNIMSDNVMLNSAKQSKTTIIFLSGFVFIIGILFAFLTNFSEAQYACGTDCE